MKNFARTKHLGVVIVIISLANAWIFGIATAQTADEGIANFYSDKFQGKRPPAARFTTQEQTHCVAQNTRLRNEGAGDKS